MQTGYIIRYRRISRGVDGSVAALDILFVLKTVGIHVIEHLIAAVQRGGGGPHTGCILGGNAAKHRVSLVNIGGDVHHKHHVVRIEDNGKRRRLHLSFRFGSAACGSVMSAGVEVVAVGDFAFTSANAAFGVSGQQRTYIVAIFNSIICIILITADAAGVVGGGDVAGVIAIGNSRTRMAANTAGAGVGGGGGGGGDVAGVIAFGNSRTRRNTANTAGGGVGGGGGGGDVAGVVAVADSGGGVSADTAGVGVVVVVVGGGGGGDVAGVVAVAEWGSGIATDTTCVCVQRC